MTRDAHAGSARPGPAGRRTRNRNASAVLDHVAGRGAPLVPACLVLLTGLPGAGKSTMARLLAPRIRATVLESDELRALLFERPVHSQRESGILFRAIRSAAAVLLAEGRPVIVDATNVSEADRSPFYDLADEAGAPLLIMALTAPESVVLRRLLQRAAEPGGYAYADRAVYDRMRGRVEPVSRPHLSVDTSDNDAVEAAVAALVVACGGEAG